MSDTLAVYLHDHLAASNFAVELLQNLHEQYGGEGLGEFAAALQVEIEKDREVLQRIIEGVGAEAPVLKEAAAWVSEKMSRFKLSRASSGEAGTFQTLETMALGVLGKLALWDALAVIAVADLRLSGYDFTALAQRAEEQHTAVEEWRLRLARTALRAASE